MQDTVSDASRKRKGGRTGIYLTVAILAVTAVFASVMGLWEGYRRRTQMQNDPRVARVWVVGTTFGAHHQVQRGSNLQKWLNERNISLLGDYELVQSQYANDPGSMEIWFNYESYLIGQPDLECHRLRGTATAFVDDLGQPYHGFLDIHGKTVGVYLPGYDHSAHEIRCVLQWMPRRPARPFPLSHAMAYTIKLPRTPRVLPPAAGLPRSVSQANKGITVTASAARLSAFKSEDAGSRQSDISQRDLTFHLRIDGGEIANDNVATDIDLSLPDPVQSARVRSMLGVTGTATITAPGRPSNAAQFAQRQLLAFTNGSFDRPLTIQDPYGLPLIPRGQSLRPVITKDLLQSAKQGNGMVWIAPVNGAGKGTDVIRIHLDVLPKSHVMYAAPVPFDFCIPVQTGDEI